MSKTLYDKIWENHLVHEQEDGTSLIYVDRHLIHEVTSPQAFEGLRNNNRKVSRPESTFAVADHNVPTSDRSKGIENKESSFFFQAEDGIRDQPRSRGLGDVYKRQAPASRLFGGPVSYTHLTLPTNREV